MAPADNETDPIDADLARAHTLSPSAYTDPAVLVKETRRIFSRSWQVAARLDALAQPGCFVTVDIAGEPIVVVRDGAELRAFYNVCRHRSGPVAVGCGRRQSLQCAYHGWTYALSGRLLRAAEMDGALGFHPDDVHLVPVRTAVWGPLVFVNLDDTAPPLATFFDDPAPEGLRFVMSRDYTLACNWKVYVDNYLEGYHLPFVHPGLHKELDYDNYRVETSRWSSLQHAPLRPSTSPGRHYDPAAGHDAPLYRWVFPNLMLNLYQGQAQVNVIVPLDAGHTRTVFEWYAERPPEEPTWSRLVGFSDEIQREDIVICEAVQRNLGSRAAAPGRYSPRRENGVHHFHRLWQEAMRDGIEGA